MRAIDVNILAVLCVLIHTTIAQEVSLDHTLFLGEYARPGQRVTFTCEARDTSVLEWHSDEYIGSGGDRIEVTRNGDGSNQTRRGGETVATTVSVNTYSGITVIISQLHIMTSEQIPTSSVMCAINGDGPRETISFTTTAISLREVSLNHTLFLGEYARPGQRVTFTCEARDTSVLEWHSDEYIGSGGDRIEVTRNGDGNNQTRRGGETVATTVSVNTYSGVTVIISQLHIMTSEQIPTSLVTCAINGNGPRKVIPINTTAISLREVSLNHTLYLGEYARPGQRVTFTCEARDASVLEWHSDEYIGTGGDRIEVTRNGDGSNQTRREGETVATTVSVNTYSGITVIVSQLHIMTSEQIPTSSVTCAINGDGPRENISFTTTDMDPNTDSMPEITSTSESIITTPDNQFHTTVTAVHDSNNSHIIAVSAVFAVLCAVIIAVSFGVVVMVMCARIKGRRKSRVGDYEMQQEQSDDVTNKKLDSQKDEYGVKQANEDRINYIETELSPQPERVANEKPDYLESQKKAEKEPLLQQQQLQLQQQQLLQPDQQMGGASQQISQQQQQSGVICDSANEQQLGPPDPKEQLGDNKLTETKQDVENPEGSQGDTTGASVEGGTNGPLGPPRDVGSNGSQQEVGHDDDSRPQVPRYIVGIGRTGLVLPERKTRKQPVGLARCPCTSLPSDSEPQCTLTRYHSEQYENLIDADIESGSDIGVMDTLQEPSEKKANMKPDKVEPQKKSEEKHLRQLGPPDPKGQLGDNKLTEVKQDVENPEGPHRYIAGTSVDGETNGSLGPRGDVGSNGFQQEIGHDDGSQPQQQLGPPNRKEQLGDTRLTEAKQNVETSQEDNTGTSVDGETNGSLGPPRDIGSNGSQQEVGRDDDSQPQDDDSSNGRESEMGSQATKKCEQVGDSGVAKSEVENGDPEKHEEVGEAKSEVENGDPEKCEEVGEAGNFIAVRFPTKDSIVGKAVSGSVGYVGGVVVGAVGGVVGSAVVGKAVVGVLSTSVTGTQI